VNGTRLKTVIIVCVLLAAASVCAGRLMAPRRDRAAAAAAPRTCPGKSGRSRCSLSARDGHRGRARRRRRRCALRAIVSGFFPSAWTSSAARPAGRARRRARGRPRPAAQGMADLRLAMPIALIASTSSIFGAMMGSRCRPSHPDRPWRHHPRHRRHHVPGQEVRVPGGAKGDALSTALRINGIYHEASTGKSVDWKIHRTPQAW